MSFPSLKGIKFVFFRALCVLFVLAAGRSHAAPEVMLGRAEYRPGVYALQSTTIPENAHEVVVSLTREDWADTGRDVVSVRVEFSDDNGKKWAYLFGFKTSGGQLKDKSGIPIGRSWLTFSLPGGNHSGRKIKGSFEVYSPIVTEVSIEFK